MYFLAFKKFYSLERIQNIEYKIIEFKNNYVLIQLLIDSILLAALKFFGTLTFSLKVAFNAGSSKHGNIFRAPTGSMCVAANHLLYK